MRRFLFVSCILFFYHPLFAQRLSLPLFDDFSAPQLSSVHWISGGAERTEGKAIQPPSLGVMTFDGRNSRGIPYQPDRPEAVGPTDTLTLQPLDLSAYTLRDSVHLRFFVQPNGRGEAPDPEDSLWVEVKNAAGDWVTLWQIRGGATNTVFRPIVVPLNQAAFYHADFQFRFRASGRQSGPFDSWHIDYVSLATLRNQSSLFFPDIALVESPAPLFRLYRGVPFRSFRLDPSRFLRDSLEIQVRNFREFTSFAQVTFSLEGPGLSQEFTPSDFQNIAGSGLRSLRYPRPVSWVPIQRGTYLYRVNLDTPESNVNTVPDFTGNDSFTQSLSIENTWQYDDGSAEGGADIDRRLGQVAQLFSMPAADTLGGVQIAFSPTFASLLGRSLQIRVWEATPNGPGRLLYQEPLRITQDSAWVNLTFQRGIVVPAQFYVGWQRLADQVVPVGLDKNSNLPDGFIWSNAGLGWQATRLSGALMVRAVMGSAVSSPSASGNVTQLVPEPIARVYPNPAQDWIRWSPLPGEFVIHNGLGREMQRGAAEQGKCFVQTWPAGVYFLTIVTKTNTFTQKWVIDR